MAFEYGCFISYRHLDGIVPFVQRLAKDIERDLASQGIPELRVFLDENRIQPGNPFNQQIPSSLCKSIVMVVIYVPAYFDNEKPYCTKEFVAFMEHEERRLREIAQKFPDYDLAELFQIIPIVLRKSPLYPIPPELDDRAPIYWQDTTAFETPGRFALTNQYIEQKRKICNRILNIWSRVPQLDTVTNCRQAAELPDEQHPLFQQLVQVQSPRFP